MNNMLIKLKFKKLFFIAIATIIIYILPIYAQPFEPNSNWYEAPPQITTEGNYPATPLIPYSSADASYDYDSDSESNESLNSDYNIVQYYTIKKGDTLGSISKKFYGTTKYWKEIAKTNNISNPAGLRVGKKIKIPQINDEKIATYKSRAKFDRKPKTPSMSSSGSQYISQSQTNPTQFSQPPINLALPPVSSISKEQVLYSDSKGLPPPVVLPGLGKELDDSRRMVTLDGITGLFQTYAAYTLGKSLFSTSFGASWNKITKRDGKRLQAGEDADYWEFPIAITYSTENFETALKIPFESYDVYAPLTYNFRDGTDSGMGDIELRLKFTSQNDNMASCLGVGAIFPTSDRKIGNTESDNAWEVFAGISTKKKEGGNFHVNLGYQAGNGNTSHEGVFFNLGFEYAANPSFTFIGEVNHYNRINNGRTTDLTLGLRYYAKPGMSVSFAAPISLNNDMFFGYDYKLLGQLQYHY